jgi:hypothetical protein
MNKPLIVLILTILFFGSCAVKYQEKIAGTWVDLEGHIWVFTADEKIIYENNDTDHREYDYKINEKKMSFIVPRANSVPDILQLYNIYLSNKGGTLDLTGGTTVPEWIIAGPGWYENKLIKISDENILGPIVSLRTKKPEEKDNLLLDDINFRDKYGNLIYQYDKRQKITYTLYYTPDIELLLQLKNKLFTLIIDNKLLKDSSFLKNLPQLEELYILESNISSLEPVKYLENLEVLNIAKGYPRIIDCSVFRDFGKLKTLDLNDNEIENIGVIYKIDNSRLEVKGIKGYEDYIEKYRSLWDSESYVFHYDKYHVFQQGVKIRAKPSNNSGIIKELNLHDEIQIIEYTDKEEKINDMWGYWYKIKQNNVTGYIFGGYIAIKTLITDIDKNGIKDYFYLRHTSGWDINPDKDILVYINNKKIDTSILSTTERSLPGYPYEKCIFEAGDGDVLIGLSQYGRHDYEYMHIFKVLPNGKVEYVQNWDEIDYW